MKHEVLTSIAPHHPIDGQQERAALSWISAGHPYATVNCADEVITVPDGVSRKDARSTVAIYGRPYVLLDDVLRSCDADVAVITNSDIELVGDLDPCIADAPNAIYIGNRFDHDGDITKGRTYDYGFDLFIIHRKFFEHIPPSLFVLGQTWWDYFLPYMLIMAGVPLRRVADRTIAHRTHPIQYSRLDWDRMTAHFKFISNANHTMSSSALTAHIHKIITRHAR